VIEPRIYRAAFIPALFALVLAMFSLENRPPGLPQGLAADVLFDGRQADRELRGIERATPDRRPGGVGDGAVADRVAARFRDHGFQTIVDRYSGEGRKLVNVVGRRAGESRHQVIVLAARDSARVPDATGSAADTAALLELARVLEGRAAQKTLVLASVDGATLGDIGARRFADTVVDRHLVDAVVVLSNMGARHARGPLIVSWSNNSRRVGIGLERTAVASLREELERVRVGVGATGQLFRLAMPVGIGAQGVLLERGLDAVRLSGSGELPPAPRERELARVDVDRLGQLGRAALRIVSAVDAGVPRQGPRSYIATQTKVIPGWALSLLAFCLILPVLVAMIDGFARARRRREPLAPWGRWLLARTLPWVVGLCVAELLVLFGAGPDLASAAPVPDDHSLGASGAAVLAATAAAVALAWYAARALTAGTGTEPHLLRPAAPGAGVVTGLLLAGLALAAWAINPYAALLMAPAFHAWLLTTQSEEPPRPPLAILLVVVGLALPAAVGAYFMVRLSLNPVEAAWYLFLLVTAHEVGLVTALLGCGFIGALTAVIGIARSRTDLPGSSGDSSEPRLRGPGGYAGPGSLGGTESALRR
jgi:hypothetical protein